MEKRVSKREKEIVQEKRIFAFISYSRKDKKVANWLHGKMESYVYPQNLVNIEQRPPHKKYVRPVFLDTKDMQVEERPFTNRIQDALRRAEFLIVISSHNAKKSVFVDKEIRYFLEAHDYNYSRIVPLFIDEVQEDSIPDAFIGTSIMHRHFPIYNTVLSGKSEANEYCFYQIIAYLLGANFSDIYNRYEVAAVKRKKWERIRMGAAIVTLAIVIVALGGVVYQRQRIIEKNEEIIKKGRELINFEKQVFPAAVVFGYEENFLSPVIHYLKERGETFKIYVFMPTSYRGLHHHDRVTDINYSLKKELNIDSLGIAHLPTSTRRGSHIFRLMKDGEFIPGVYLDFASTTTSFYKIAEYKKENEAYKRISIDDIIKEYTQSFIMQTNAKLEADSVYLTFVTDKENLLDMLKEDISDSIVNGLNR